MSASDWTFTDQYIASQAFELGKQRLITSLINTLQRESSQLDTAESIWRLHDFLSSARYQYEGRSDFEFSTILFHLADMLKHNLISLEDLNGLEQSKLSKVIAMAMF